VDLYDVRRALDDAQVHVVPNHFKTALQSVDSGVPVYDEAPHAAITRGLLDIYAEVIGRPKERRELPHRAALPC
jgi:Flp pilus assembly CpaE family ATPase